MASKREAEGWRKSCVAAQQAADRERVAKVRDESVRTKQMESLEARTYVRLLAKWTQSLWLTYLLWSLRISLRKSTRPTTLSKGWKALRAKGKLDDDSYKAGLIGDADEKL